VTSAITGHYTHHPAPFRSLVQWRYSNSYKILGITSPLIGFPCASRRGSCPRNGYRYTRCLSLLAFRFPDRVSYRKSYIWSRPTIRSGSTQLRLRRHALAPNVMKCLGTCTRPNLAPPSNWRTLSNPHQTTARHKGTAIPNQRFPICPHRSQDKARDPSRSSPVPCSLGIRMCDPKSQPTRLALRIPVVVNS